MDFFGMIILKPKFRFIKEKKEFVTPLLRKLMIALIYTSILLFKHNWHDN